MWSLLSRAVVLSPVWMGHFSHWVSLSFPMSFQVIVRIILWGLQYITTVGHSESGSPEVIRPEEEEKALCAPAEEQQPHGLTWHQCGSWPLGKVEDTCGALLLKIFTLATSFIFTLTTQPHPTPSLFSQVYILGLGDTHLLVFILQFPAFTCKTSFLSISHISHCFHVAKERIAHLHKFRREMTKI